MKKEENTQEQIGQMEEATNHTENTVDPTVVYSDEEKLQAIAALTALSSIASVKFTLPKWAQHIKPGQQPYIVGSTELSLFSQEELGAIKEISKKYIQTLA